MPYISQEIRPVLLNAQALQPRIPRNGGELCFILTMACKRYLEDEPENFDRYGDIRHALATAWDEYFLPRLQKYESIKRHQNGDLE